MRIRATIAGLVFLAGAVPDLHASESEHALTTGVSYDQCSRSGERRAQGLGVQVGYRYGLSDDFVLRAAAGYTGFLGPGLRFDVVSADAGIAYLVDALTFVPEIRVGVGYVGPGSVRYVKPDAALIGGVALEYRRVRAFGVGISAEYRFLIRNRDEAGGILSILLYVSKYF